MKSVLVVDDDLETRDTIAGLLEEEGYVVLVASDGTNALAQLASGDVGLALVDLLMPKMNGWTLLEALAADASFGHVPVVVLTALSKVSLPIGVPVLRKPFEFDTLLELVRQSIGSPGEDSPSRARSRRESGIYPLGLVKCAAFGVPELLLHTPARGS
jgi:CheY-like chemotaxis protein